MLKKINPKLMVIVGVIFVSFSAILAKMSDAPALIIAAYRLSFTVLLLLPSVITKHTAEMKKVDPRSLFICMISGIFLALHFATWMSSIKYTSIASAVVLVNTHPIFIVAASYLLFKEKVTKKILSGILVAFIGGVIISFGDFTLGSNILLGDLLAIAGAFFVAGYFLIGRIVRQKLSATVYTFLVYSSATVILILLAIFTKTPLYPYSVQDMLIFLGLAVFCTICGHSIFNWALEYVSPTFISTAVLGEPVAATLWAMMIFAEFPTLWQLGGSAIIVLGIYLYARFSQEEEKQLKLKRDMGDILQTE